MIWGKYTAFLEKENERLNARLNLLEARYYELAGRTHQTAALPLHEISKGTDQAHCSCGWSFLSEDPGQLQGAISSHYRAGAVARGRKSWPQVKSALEGADNGNR